MRRTSLRLIGRHGLLSLVVFLVLIGAQLYFQRHRSLPAAPSSPSTTVVLGDIAARSKTAGCQVNGAFPDSACTPGSAIVGVTAAQVCTSGYSTSVRSVTEAEKQAVFDEYGIATHSAGQYEVDHFVSLEVGGSNDIANLWPEAAAPVPGFHEKDTVENWLHDQVCSGKLTLDAAQKEEVGDWVALYRQIAP